MSVWRRNTTNILVGGILLVIIAMGVGFFLTLKNDSRVDLQIASGVYKAYVANNQAEREKGLSEFTSLSDSEAMLFVFDSDDRWGIWMKDMQIPIDVVWLTADKVVVDIERNLSPELGDKTTFYPEEPARYVLEVAAGGVTKAGIKVGQRAVFNVADVR